MTPLRQKVRRIVGAALFGFLASASTSVLLAFVPLSSKGPIGLHIDPDSNDPLKTIQVCESIGFGAARYEWAPLTPLKPDTDFDSIYSLWKSRSEEGEAMLEESRHMLIRYEIPRETFFHPSAWPRWARMPSGRAVATGLALDEGQARDARGFPFLAFTCNTPVVSASTTPRPSPLHWGLPLSPSSRTIGTRWKAIALQPLIPGLLGNIVFFGFAWIALPYCIRRVRATNRREEGNCPSCGYELKGDFGPGCPECGWNHRPHPSIG